MKILHQNNKDVVRKFKSLIIVMTFFTNTVIGQEFKFSENFLTARIETKNGLETNMIDLLESIQYDNAIILFYNAASDEFLQNITKIKELQKANEKLRYIFLSTDLNKIDWKKSIEKNDLIGQYFIFKNPENTIVFEELQINSMSSKIIGLKNNKVMFSKTLETRYIELDDFLKTLKYSN